MALFFDSSALAKRYIKEDGSTKVIELVKGEDKIFISILLPVEIISALNRLNREKYISTKQYKFLNNAVIKDMQGFHIISIQSNVVTKSIESLEKGSLRTLDAIQIASAIVSKCNLFVTSDKRQEMIAQKMGLRCMLI